ncbi:hypothetical protein [Thomasclavelia spiroformis]|uniref:hypothetical protein n=1 Tax=Thomasclavelia spiroformis TaxID=29348 RepID=UPI0032096AC5
MNEREIEINNAMLLVRNILKDFKLTLTIGPALTGHTIVIVDETNGKKYVLTKEWQNE